MRTIAELVNMSTNGNALKMEEIGKMREMDTDEESADDTIEH